MSKETQTKTIHAKDAHSASAASSTSSHSAVVVVRLRGSKETRTPIEHTLTKFLLLNRVQSCTVVPVSTTSKGWLQLVKDYVTWAPVEEKTVATLLEKRGLINGKPLAKAITSTKYKDVATLAKEIAAGKKVELPGFKRIFHLSPPKGGFVHRTKKPFPEGELGKRPADSMAKLLAKMM